MLFTVFQKNWHWCLVYRWSDHHSSGVTGWERHNGAV